MLPDPRGAWNPAKRAWTRVDGAVSVSPDERWQVRQNDGASGVPKVTFLDRRSGKESEVELPVPEDPEREGQYLQTVWPTWSPDGRRLLLNVFEPGGEPRSAGIVLIDVPSLEARFVRIEKALITVGGFQWTPGRLRVRRVQPVGPSLRHRLHLAGEGRLRLGHPYRQGRHPDRAGLQPGVGPDARLVRRAAPARPGQGRRGRRRPHGPGRRDAGQGR
ncbi:hypothetical protein ACIA8R_11020 [Nonomuraea sp. NPDC051191]|uniref:hypothetical protein n=1 Tax=Nonomuraea sp. NPDC051191 TaxID=3364372 RepID=UPI0037A0CFBA